jgi:predicted metal-dependent hydrolase
MSDLIAPGASDCHEPLHPKAIQGMELMNNGHYFEAHEALEAAWREETGPVRDLYRGILQVAVVYLHVTHANHPGAIKVYRRCQKWLNLWPETCRGVAVGQLRQDLETVIEEVSRLGPNHLDEFDLSLLKPVTYAKN